MNVIVVSGGFDPIHSGHIEYLKSARSKGDILVVCLNSDQWLEKKKGKYFLQFSERAAILEAISYVDKVIDFEDDNLGSCINGLRKVQEIFPNDQIFFCNGGDRNKDNIPEMSLEGINFLFSVGGDNKINSSSSILKKWQFDHEKRVWGEFYNLYELPGVKVKELIVFPQSGMSFQRHKKRNEIWFIADGECSVNFSKGDPADFEEIKLKKNETFFVNVNCWHQIFNDKKNLCRIIEIQFGDQTIEDDIERICYYPETPK